MMVVSLRRVDFQATADGPHLLVSGGVHGDEFEPIEAIRRLIDLFETRDVSVSDFRGRVTFIPIVNEAAFLRGHRCAEDGLDLARTCPGNPNGNVTEQTAWALSEAIREADFYIDLHTGGTELSVYPLAGYVMHANPEVLETQRAMARAFNLPVVWGTAANLDGRSLSVARDANIPAIYCEYLGAATCDANGVDVYFHGCLNVMSELGMLDRTKPPNRVVHFVENPRPNSGHMQICNPAPVTGFFSPSVKLGDPIEQGDAIGTVYPLDGGKPVIMHSTQRGIVIVLRTFPRARIGESVGVILETLENS